VVPPTHRTDQRVGSRIAAIGAAPAPWLLATPDCGVLGAVIVGETAGAGRFSNKDAYVRFTGNAPIPVWSGNSNGKVRLNRGGNQTINTRYT
jgi:transposase